MCDVRGHQSVIPAIELGVKPLSKYDQCRRRFESQQRILQSEDFESHPENLGSLSRPLMLRFASDAAEMLAWSDYMSGKWAECRYWCRKVGESLIELFMGDWRCKEMHEDGAIDPDRWFQDPELASWTTPLESGLGWVAVGGHWGLVDLILEFPKPTLAVEYGGRVAHDYYVGLARWWQTRSDVDWIEEVKQVRGAGSKGYHLLCDAISSISVRDVKGLSKSLTKYVEHYMKARPSDDHFPLPATFLWQAAAREGLQTDLPREIDKFLFRLPEKQ